MTPAVATSDSRAQGSMFEALFQRALKPSPAMLAELRDAGYLPAELQPTYPTAIWARCLDIAVRHTYPSLSREAGYRQIGRRFTESFLDTLAGRVVAVAVPFLSPQGFVTKMPRYLKMGRSDVTFVLTPSGPSGLVGVLSDPFGIPGDFLAGILEVGIQLTKANPMIKVTRIDDTSSELLIRW